MLAKSLAIRDVHPLPCPPSLLLVLRVVGDSVNAEDYQSPRAEAAEGAAGGEMMEDVDLSGTPQPGERERPLCPLHLHYTTVFWAAPRVPRSLNQCDQLTEIKSQQRIVFEDPHHSTVLNCIGKVSDFRDQSHQRTTPVESPPCTLLR